MPRKAPASRALLAVVRSCSAARAQSQRMQTKQHTCSYVRASARAHIRTNTHTHQHTHWLYSHSLLSSRAQHPRGRKARGKECGHCGRRKVHLRRRRRCHRGPPAQTPLHPSPHRRALHWRRGGEPLGFAAEGPWYHHCSCCRNGGAQYAHAHVTGVCLHTYTHIQACKHVCMHTD